MCKANPVLQYIYQHKTERIRMFSHLYSNLSHDNCDEQLLDWILPDSSVGLCLFQPSGSNISNLMPNATLNRLEVVKI